MAQRYQTIESMKREHTLAQLCAVFEVKRSSYHAWTKAEASERERTDARLLAKIRDVHERHQGRYGAPRTKRNWRHKATTTAASALRAC